MITEKENYLRILRGEKPEWVPRYRMGVDENNPCCTVSPGPLARRDLPNGNFLDIWGVEFVGTESMGGAALPVPGKFILEDVTKWRDVIKAPDLSGVDWEAQAAKDLAGIDRDKCAVKLNLGGGYFMNLMNMMGFMEGLMALYTEPEAVKELMQYLSDFYCGVEEQALKYYKPDIFGLGDDMATAQQPFISLDCYHEFFEPCHRRETEMARAAGCFVDFHCCGNCQMFIDDWIDMGVQAWNPAQVSNDLKAIQKKYPDLTLIGCWDSQGPAGWLETGEEETKAFVRECIDTYAPSGKFIFWGSIYGAPDNQAYLNKARWLQEEYDRYGRTFYQTHPIEK